MISSVRRHSLRLQSEIHRWSICDPGSHFLFPDSLLARVPACISRSKSCASSAGESDGGSSRGSWSSSSDSVISTDSVNPYRVVLLGAGGVGKTAFSCIFSGAADSMDSDDCELCGGKNSEM